MAHSLLVTQCLQNDFVRPLPRFAELPNQLHIGHAEARRLLGDDPTTGPVARIMRWAYGRSADELAIVHIRDWHDPSDPRQREHLERFGLHCQRETAGAELAFPEPESATATISTVESQTLNDFVDTDLADVLAPHASERLRVGLIGVWTEAKISFLAYELATRYPSWDLAVCSALTASSSRNQHFLALTRLARLLPIRIIDSIGDFVEFLGGTDAEVPLLAAGAVGPEIAIESGELTTVDHELISYLFRDCREVQAKSLDGGFSGNVVLGTESVDLGGHPQVAHVVKIGPRDLIGRERTSFESIEAILGNTAPRIADFADRHGRGAIKYRYASMGGGFSTTFQKEYMTGLLQEKVDECLDIVFKEQLGRLYSGATQERCDLLEYYLFDSRWADSVASKVEAILGVDQPGETIEPIPGHPVPNVARFYSDVLDTLPRRGGDSVWFAQLHGDLNGANIILDARSNVWIIDFFHSSRGHILKDLIKLENDLLYIFSELTGNPDLGQAALLTDALLNVEDLGRPLPDADQIGLEWEPFLRAWRTIQHLRSFYPALVREDRDPLQLLIGQLRYSVHTLGFDESSPLQKRWALHTSCRLAQAIEQRMRSHQKLRVDWIDPQLTSPGRLGLTILPGRRDLGRNLDEDLDLLESEGIAAVVVLVPRPELASYGVPDLVDALEAREFEVRELPILDQKVPTATDLRELTRWLRQRLVAGDRVLIHCVGGLGRTGTVAACTLIERGLGADEAIAAVRAARTSRAIETKLQEDFVRNWTAE